MIVCEFEEFVLVHVHLDKYFHIRKTSKMSEVLWLKDIKGYQYRKGHEVKTLVP